MSCKLVLLTGISGFVAAHIAVQLLEAGYRVRGTVRSQKKADAIKQSPHFKPYLSQLEFAIIEDVATSDFSEAVKGVDAVFHTASPFNVTAKGNWETQFYNPAIKGTKNVIAAAAKESSIKNFLVTSSFAAVGTFSGDFPLNSKTYTENDWNEISWDDSLSTDAAAVAYCASKKWAEKAAYDFAKDNKVSFKVASFCPPMIFGPILHPIDKLDSLNESSGQLWQLVSGNSKEIPPTGFPAFTDVRVVARAHIAAYEKDAEGRFLIYSGPYDNQKVADFVRKEFLAIKERVPKGTPGEYVEKKPKAFKLDPSRGKTELGLQYPTFEQTFKDSVASLVDLEKQGL